MTTNNDIINESKKYLDAHDNQAKRFRAWATTLPVVKTTLDRICAEMISSNDYFKSNLYVVDDSANLRVYIMSGQVSVPLSNNDFEKGFEIHFMPINNGRIFVFAYGHSIGDSPKQIKIDFIDDPTELTEEKVIELILKGLEEVRKTSYLFAGDN